MSTHREGRWIIRQMRYAQAPPITAQMLEADLDLSMTIPINHVTRVEAIWTHTLSNDGKLFPELDDIMDAVYAAERIFSRRPDVVVTSLPVGSKVFGVEVR